MKKWATSLIVGGLVGASSAALMNIDKSNMRKAKRTGKRLLNRAENLMEDMRGFR